MSGMNTLRRLTETDTERLEAAAERFAARHGIKRTVPGWVEYTIEGETYRSYYAPTAYSEVSNTIEPRENPRLARLWQACFCRALGYRPCADLTIGWGYVGTNCK